MLLVARKGALTNPYPSAAPRLEQRHSGASANNASEMAERTRNPLTSSATGGRVLSGMQLPLFMVRPPANYGVLTTRGRKSGKRRRRCVRAVRASDKVVIVAIKGERTSWLKNLRANPEISLRIRSGSVAGTTRQPRDEEWGALKEAYCIADQR